MPDHPTLTIDILRDAVSDGVAAIRSVVRLQPAGGPGDKVFPPTYATGDSAVTRYAFETRRIDGENVECVLLDSVPSQANRMEEALLDAWRRGLIPLPVVQVDFSQVEGLEDLEQITSLDAPHRIADALLRDSLLDGKLFRDSVPGRSFTDAKVTDATALYHYCPTALVFGMWDSTGPKGGLGAKFARAIVSEIVGVNAHAGVKTASRIDPAGIEKLKGTKIYRHPTEGWTLEQKQAAKTGKNKLDEIGERPSEINHGNVAPTIDDKAGGVTLDHALQTTVLSLPALRRLGFRTTTDGEVLENAARREAELAARTVLASLGLAAVALHRRQGYDLRSRCLLIPDGALSLEMVPADGGEAETYALDSDAAAALLGQAVDAAVKHGLAWPSEAIHLEPAPKLAALIRRSREAAVLEPAGSD